MNSKLGSHRRISLHSEQLLYSHKGAAYVIDGPTSDNVKKLTDSRRNIYEDHSSRRGKKSSNDAAGEKNSGGGGDDDGDAAAEEEA